MADTLPRLEVVDNEAATDEILAFADGLLAATVAPFVVFEVVYPLGDQPREDRWSAADRVEVTRDGRIRGEAVEG